MTLPRPCIGCGRLIDKGSRCSECKPKYAPKLSPAKRGYDQRWRKLSERVRKAQPWCTWCGWTDSLQADHIITVLEDESLRLAPENLRVLCFDCHRDRPPTTDAERQAVMLAVGRRKQRAARFHTQQT